MLIMRLLAVLAVIFIALSIPAAVCGWIASRATRLWLGRPCGRPRR
jgi:hypothetical protein